MFYASVFDERNSFFTRTFRPTQPTSCTALTLMHLGRAHDHMMPNIARIGNYRRPTLVSIGTRETYPATISINIVHRVDEQRY